MGSCDSKPKRNGQQEPYHNDYNNLNSGVTKADKPAPRTKIERSGTFTDEAIIPQQNKIETQ